MNTQQLRQRINTQFRSYGHWRVTIEYRGKEYSCITTNSLAIDRMNDDDHRDEGKVYNTPKSALMAIWNECKQVNELN